MENKKYELSNHLGNVLSVISDNKIGVDNVGSDLIADIYEPLVISESDYYPFGMAMKERSFSNEEYRFGFNGMEKDNDLGEDSYTTEFRMWNSEVVRWISIDPKYKEYESPYVWNTNNPISYTDVFGGDSTERAQFVERARMYVAARNKNGGNLYGFPGSLEKTVSPSDVENGTVLDCASFMAQCLRQFNIPLGKWQLDMNGVETVLTSSMIQNIASSAKGAKSHLSQNQINEAVVGYLVTFRSGRSGHKGEDGKFDHIGVISSINKDKSGNVISFTVIEAGGKIGPRESFTYEVDNPKKWKYTLKGLWKWDQKPDDIVYDGGTLKTVVISSSRTLTMQELLEDAKEANAQLQELIENKEQIDDFIERNTNQNTSEDDEGN